VLPAKSIIGAGDRQAGTTPGTFQSGRFLLFDPNDEADVWCQEPMLKRGQRKNQGFRTLSDLAKSILVRLSGAIAISRRQAENAAPRCDRFGRCGASASSFNSPTQSWRPPQNDVSLARHACRELPRCQAGPSLSFPEYVANDVWRRIRDILGAWWQSASCPSDDS